MKIQRSFEDLDYDLELDSVAKAIKKEKARKVLIQLPDGFKPYATQIADELRKQTQNKAEILIWMGSCFGACDVPLEAGGLGVDLIV